jgi:hypothetical protein
MRQLHQALFDHTYLSAMHWLKECYVLVAEQDGLQLFKMIVQ